MSRLSWHFSADQPVDIRPLAPLVHSATLVQYNEFGQRVDRLHTSEGWRQLEYFAVKEGYAAVAYERKFGEYSRTFQFARTMVMTGDCHAVSLATARLLIDHTPGRPCRYSENGNAPP